MVAWLCLESAKNYGFSRSGSSGKPGLQSSVADAPTLLSSDTSDGQDEVVLVAVASVANSRKSPQRGLGC